MAFAAGSCSRQTPAATEPQAVTETIVFKDYGAEPTVLDIESYTLANENFRTVLWTGGNLQVTVMAIPVGGDVGLELHNGIDQFLRVEEGTAQVMMGDSADKLDFVKGRLCDLRPGRQMAQHRQQGRQTAEDLFDLRSRGASSRHDTQNPAGVHGSRARALTGGKQNEKRVF